MHQYTDYLERIYKENNFSSYGLKSSQILPLKNKYGANKLSKNKKNTLFMKIVNALLEPMMLILVVALIITIGVNIGNFFAGKAIDPFESIGIFLSVALSVGLTVIMENKSEKAFEMLKSFTENISVTCFRDGKKIIVSNSEICVGDVVYQEAGEKIVADGLVIESSNFETDESTLTGESINIRKDNFNYKKVLSSNIAYSGTYIKSGYAKILILAVGDNAQIGKIAFGLNKENTISAPLADKLNKLTKNISIFGAISAVFVFLLSIFRLFISNSLNIENIKDAFIEAIVLIVAAIPEGLPTTVAISLALSVVRLAKSNAVIKKLVAAETVGCVSVICSDKTGTLTFGKMEIDCFIKNNTKLEKTSKKLLTVYENIVFNSTAFYSQDSSKQIVLTGNSTERALISYFFDKNPQRLECERKAVIIEDRLTFSSENKYMKTKIRRSDGSAITYYKGSIEVLADLCELTSLQKIGLFNKAAEFEKQSERIIAFAYEKDGIMYFDGFCAITDKLRPDVALSVLECQKAGINVKILTGDNKETALSIASKLSLKCGALNCISGNEVNQANDYELMEKLQNISVVYRSTPETKLRIVNLLKKSGEVVAVTGDGVNDAPAIKNADIGIAMGDGSEITKEASDIILLDNSFSVIVKAVSFGRNIYKNFQSFLFFQLTVNFSSVGLILAFLMLGFSSPFSALQLLWINVIMDGPLALSLGLERREGEFLNDKPVKRSDSIVTKKMFYRIVFHAVYVVVLIIAQKKYNFLNVSIEKTDTVIFCLFVSLQLFNSLNAREMGVKSIFHTLLNNKLFNIFFSLSFIMQILLSQFANKMFDTVPLEFSLWIKIILLSISVVVISETYKLIFKKIFKSKFYKKISKRRKFA